MKIPLEGEGGREKGWAEEGQGKERERNCQVHYVSTGV